MRKDVNNVLFEYCGYRGTLNYSVPEKRFFGRVLIENNENLGYTGMNRNEAETAFRRVIDSLLIAHDASKFARD